MIFHYSKNANVYYLSLFVILVNYNVQSQQLQNKYTDKSCSTKDKSKNRVHSLMIVKNIHSKHGEISTFNECASLCYNAGSSTCPYFGYQLGSKSCLFFKENLQNETISRLLSESWRYGRVLANKATREYFPWDSCTEPFCQNTCLKAVQELCSSSGEWDGANCDLYTGIVSSCEEVLTKTYTLITGETINATHGPTFKYNLLFPSETAPVKLTCPLPKGVLTRIEAASSYNLCLEPRTKDCSGVEWTELRYYSKDTHCQDASSLFIFNPDKGILWHACSGKQVCYSSIKTYERLRLRNEGDCNINPRYVDSASGFLFRTYFNGIQSGKNIMRSSHNSPRNDREVFLGKENENHWSWEYMVNTQYFFTGMQRGPVKTLWWESYFGHTNDEDSADYVGYMDMLAGMQDIKDWYSLKQKAIFVAPQTGVYSFFSCPDDFVKFYISTDATPDNKENVLDANLCFLPDHRTSTPVTLQANNKYYVEVLFVEGIGSDFFYIGMTLPDLTEVEVITSKYLEPYE
ncbi:uncharacterized protein [Clytia hemisphaerica]|uniref:Uncharacterized protein n=1 Tax=Clytia hemisphaerica TaxID=252671 RepID=A0A7M5XBA7_9CNID|eukprot:TCONS_00064139-protein